MNKLKIVLIVSLLFLLISCETEYPDGIVISGFPKGFQLSSIINISSRDNSTIIQAEISGKTAELVITPSIEKILKPEPDSIKVDKVYRPSGVTTFINFYKEGVLRIIIADNATETDKVLGELTITLGNIIASKDTQNISLSNRIKTSIIIHNSGEKIHLNPGEIFQTSFNNLPWEFYYFNASIPNINLYSDKNISLDRAPFIIDWIIMQE